MADHDDKHEDAIESSDAHESTLENYTGSELPYKALYIAGVALAVTSVVFAVAVIPLSNAFVSSADKRTDGQILPVNERPAASRLQQSPEADWRVWEALMEEQMTSYGYNDKANGLVHIPTDRAIELALSSNLVRSTSDAVPAVLHGVSAGHDSGEEQTADGEHSGSGEASH